MSLARLINRPCTIRRKTEGETRNKHGNAVSEIVETETVCELQQQPAFRSESDEAVSENRWQVYLLPGETVGSGDSIDIEGAGEFEVFGEPWEARNPRTGRASHIEVAVRRTAGPAESPRGGS